MLISPLEIAANIVVTAAILLAARNSVHTWWTGLIGCLLFGVLFFQVNLYADVALQLFFVFTSAFGWWNWLYGNCGKEQPISRCNPQVFIWIIPTGIITTACYGALLHYWTNAYAPFIDSSVLVFSVIAQLLLMQRKVESWYFWLLVNTVAVPLYFSRELYLTAFLYGVYWINALIALRLWRQSFTDENQSSEHIPENA